MKKEINKDLIVTVTFMAISILLLILSVSGYVSCSSCTPTFQSSYEREQNDINDYSKVIAKKFIKLYLKNPDDADIDILDIDQYDILLARYMRYTYDVFMKTKNKNDFGSEIVSFIQFSIRYKYSIGGDPEDINNWEHSTIVIYNQNSGQCDSIVGSY